MNRHIQAIFCDDIRHEVGNKVSFMGVYSGQLLVPSLPVILPKLCVVTSVMTSVEEPFEQLTVRLFKDDEVLTEISLTAEQLAAPLQVMNEETEDSSFPVFLFQTAFIISPLVIDSPCVLRVFAENEADEIRSLSLKIRQLPEAV